MDPQLRQKPRKRKNDTDTVMDNEVLNIIADCCFWADLDDLQLILEPIHKAQKMSESSKAHLGYVIQQWNSIFLEWMRLNHNGRYPQIQEIIDKVWIPHHRKQNTDLNWLAFALDPANENRTVLTPEMALRLIELIKQHVDSARHRAAIDQYFEFCDCIGLFNTKQNFWSADWIKNSLFFWKVVAGVAPDLSPLAIWMFSTIANSVPSEHSFSGMNFVQNEYRTGLNVKQTDMLTFIYINDQLLQRLSSLPSGADIPQGPTWYNIDAELEEQLEDEAFAKLEDPVYESCSGSNTSEDES